LNKSNKIFILCYLFHDTKGLEYISGILQFVQFCRKLYNVITTDGCGKNLRRRQYKLKHNYKRILAVLLTFVVLALPGIASAEVYYTIKLNINGQTSTIKLPIDLNSIAKNSVNTFRLVYTYKDGKWVLTSKEGTLPGKSEPVQNPAPKAPVEEPSKPQTPAPSTPEVKGLTADESKMLELVNQERQKAGLKPLTIDMRLVDISRKKSKDMIDKNYFGHTSPTYGTPFDALKNNGISYRYAGENLAGAPTVEQAHKGLMNSPGHRANILNPNFTHIGIGVVEGGPYGKMFTQTFIGVN